MRLRILAAFLSLGSVTASATCIERFFEISGFVRSIDGKPVAGAEVSASWTEATGTDSVRATTAFDGSYRLLKAFKAPSEPGKLGGNRCARQLDLIRLTVRKDGHEDLTQRIGVDTNRMTVNLTLE